MNRILRRIRGVVGTGLTWAATWVGLGAGIGALAGLNLQFILQIALGNSVSGFLAGGAFAVILSVAERNHSLEELSLKRVGLWGAVGAAALSLLPLAYGVPVGYLLGPILINGAIGAGMAAGSVALARRADRKELRAGEQDALLGMGGR